MQIVKSVYMKCYLLYFMQILFLPKHEKKKKKKRRKRFFFPYSNKSMTIIQGVILFCLLTLAVV